MLKNQKSTAGTAVFYKPVGVVTEMRAGYLYKSPPSRRLKAEKSWKRRYFVLFKINEQEHQLKYFRSADERDRPLGGIDLAQISLMFLSPQNHPKWAWIQKSFKCSPSCVLYIKVAERDYFLVGENSGEVDEWFSNLFNALKNRPHRVHSPEELSFEQPVHPGVISRPIQKKPRAASVAGEADVKLRSMSDPSPPQSNGLSEMKRVDHSNRPLSEPVNPIYDYPRSYLKNLQKSEQVWRNDETSVYMCMDAVYESIMLGERAEQQAQEAHSAVEEATGGTLMRSVTQIYDRMKTPISPLPEETTTEERVEEKDRDSKDLTDFSSSSSENGANSPVEMLSGQNRDKLEKQSSTESLDDMAPEEKDIEVSRADLKKHLTLMDVDGKPCVSGWTGQQQTVCLFHKGDQILAINDLHTSSVEEFNLYHSKILKNQVKLTILRLPGCLPLHSTSCACSD